MPFAIAQFPDRADLLLNAADEFNDSLAEDDVSQDEAEGRLLAAATPASGVALKFETKAGAAAARGSVADELAAILNTLQSGNLLVAAELKKRNVETGIFDDARDQIAAARIQVAAPAAPLRFANTLNVQSASLDSAKEAFRNYSDQLLSEIVDESLTTIKSAVGGAAKLGLGNIGDAIAGVGQGFPVFQDAARLVRTGFDSIKKALDALVALIGPKAIDDVKEVLASLWERVGQGGKAVLEPILKLAAVKARIEEILASAGLEIGGVDRSTNSLAPLSGSFSRENTLLRLLLTGLGVAASLLKWFNLIAAPGLIAIGAAYLTAVGAVLVVGGEYTGGRRWLARVDGVGQIAERMRPHPA